MGSSTTNLSLYKPDIDEIGWGASVNANMDVLDDSALTNATHTITGAWTFSTQPSGIDHTQLSNIGTNTHAQIDTHIASTANPHSVDIDDVTPTTTKGDVIVEEGSNAIRLAVGSNTQVLTADSGEASGVKWADAAGGVTDHGALTGLTDDDHVRYFDKDGSKAMTGDLDFANLKAIAMVCDNGSTLPTSGLTKGQWFRHIPTGRDILYQYHTSSWKALQSFGAMDVYVDKTDGTDALTHGTAVDSDAFASIGFARGMLPLSLDGDVIIHVNNETYTENNTFLGKAFTDDYKITVEGTLSNQVGNTTADIFSTTTIGRVGSGWTVNAFANMLVRINSGTGSANNQVAVIQSNTADTLTIAGFWADTDEAPFAVTRLGVTPDGTSVFTIDDFGTQVTSSSNKTFEVAGAQQNLYFKFLDLRANTGASANNRALSFVNHATIGTFGCSMQGGRVCQGEYFGVAFLKSTYVTASNTLSCVRILAGANIVTSACLIKDGGAGIAGIRLSGGFATFLSTVVDNMGSHGIYGERGSVIITATNNTYKNNGGWGAFMESGAVAINIQADTYSGNTSGTFTPVTMLPGGTS